MNEQKNFNYQDYFQRYGIHDAYFSRKSILMPYQARKETTF